MGNPVYKDVNCMDYKSILERGLSNGDLFVEKIMEKGKSKYCVFSTKYDYIFWQEDHDDGNLTLCLQINRTSPILQYITGSITRIGEIMCDSTIKDKPLIDYLNTVLV